MTVSFVWVIFFTTLLCNGKMSHFTFHDFLPYGVIAPDKSW
jgi:hypothetical protein